ncbi:helix-turn-helix transcriptional regulator [Streptacidiphilus monticola]|uniref:Helix-turn-helix transcriptional regulator n=1 Tax=Streptacidiphilus monticola TaxID=2161674 RepID=A0ABW1FU97_9ACTN
MGTAMDRAELADFLRRSRERLRPEDVGLVSGPRRRTPGLRREEVVQLAGMSADYYMRLEQARSPQPSTQMLAALARALRLTEDERDHLYLLAGHRPPLGRTAGERLRPGLVFLLEQLEHTPAQVIDDLGNLLAQNLMAEALFGCACTVTGPGRNVVWRWFTDPSVREPYPEEEREVASRVHVADLRAAVARRGRDEASTRLVAGLREASAEFAGLWDRHEVAVRRRTRFRVVHADLGPLELDCEQLLTPTEDQQLLVFTPPPGSATAPRLARLRGLRHDELATPA